MANIVYPLERVLEIKKRRVDQAEKVVQEKKQALQKEEEKLKQCEEERDKVKQHLKDKINQLRDELDGGTTSPKIQQMKVYIDVVKENLEVEERKVKEQKEQVKIAENNLELAKEELRLRRQEVDKMETHRKSWLKQMLREQQLEEEKEMDEIGQILYSLNRRKK